MQPSKIFVVHTGIVNPLGHNSKMIATFFKAGVSVVQETASLNKQLKPIKMALIPDQVLDSLHPRFASVGLSTRQKRMLRIAGTALSQLKPYIDQSSPISMVLALPESIPGVSNPWKGNVIEHLRLQCDMNIDLQHSVAAEIGRAGGLHAIKHVFQLMDAGQDLVLLGGMDTYWDAGLLARLDQEDRLLVQGSVDGFQPGEGACFILLASERLRSQLSPPHVALHPPGIAEELGHRYSDVPYRGDGLANAVRQAIAQAPAVINSVWTSMIYDSFCSKEFGVALARNNSHFDPNLSSKHPADSFGDLGAAIGPTLIALITEFAKLNSKIEPHHLLCCSSDTGYRSAVRLTIE